MDFKETEAAVTASLLICALALPPTNFRYAESLNPFLREIAQIREFVRKRVPGAQIVITPPSMNPGIGYEQLPFTWHGMLIWIRRPDVHDNGRLSNGVIRLREHEPGETYRALQGLFGDEPSTVEPHHRAGIETAA